MRELIFWAAPFPTVRHTENNCSRTFLFFFSLRLGSINESLVCVIRVREKTLRVKEKCISSYIFLLFGHGRWILSCGQCQIKWKYKRNLSFSEFMDGPTGWTLFTLTRHPYSEKGVVVWLTTHTERKERLISGEPVDDSLSLLIIFHFPRSQIK